MKNGEIRVGSGLKSAETGLCAESGERHEKQRMRISNSLSINISLFSPWRKQPHTARVVFKLSELFLAHSACDLWSE